jgi:hypothetical protein
MTNDPKSNDELHQTQKELEMFRKKPERNSSVYFIMKRNG